MQVVAFIVVIIFVLALLSDADRTRIDDRPKKHRW